MTAVPPGWTPEQARKHANGAMADLRAKTGDDRSDFYTQGLTNWLPTLADDIAALLELLDEARTALEQCVLVLSPPEKAVALLARLPAPEEPA